jgi:hypothetical protein
MPSIPLNQAMNCLTIFHVNLKEAIHLRTTRNSTARPLVPSAVLSLSFSLTRTRQPITRYRSRDLFR